MLLLLFCKLAYSTFENRYLSKELFQSICEDYKWDKGLYTGVIINHQIEEIYSKFDIHLNSFRECERKLDCFKKDDTSEEKIHLENELKRVKHEMLELYNNLQEKHQALDDIVVPEDPSVDHRAKTLEIEKSTVFTLNSTKISNLKSI